MKNKLAIIIPAYKKEFIDYALESIANQTCKDFTLYIGDDASPYDIYESVKKYQDKINIVYERFQTNVGSKNLVGQWERCISLSNEEEWIWLFSDDDTMDSNCVEIFYNQLESDKQSNSVKEIYHFNTEIINSNDKVIQKSNTYPLNLSSFDFFKKRMKFQIESFVVEYIFSRRVYENNNGFVQLDLAWGSDHATWIKFGHHKGIRTISGPIVKWRKSNINITQQNNDYQILIRKAEANAAFLEWSIDFFKQQKSPYPLSAYYHNKYIINSLKELHLLYGYKTTHNLLSLHPFPTCKQIGKLHIILHLFIFNLLYKLKTHLIKLI